MLRKVRLTVKASDFQEVMKSLKMNENYADSIAFTLDLEVEDVKENYKYLSTSPKILDWDIIQEEVENELPPQETEKEEPEPNYPDQVYKFMAPYLQNYDAIIAMLYVVWIEKSTIHPKGRFTCDFFDGCVIPGMKGYAVPENDINTKVAKFTLSSYYASVPMGDIVYDVFEKLEKMWDQVGKSNSVADLIAYLVSPETPKEFKDSDNIIEIHKYLVERNISLVNPSIVSAFMYDIWTLLKKSPSFRFTTKVIQDHIFKGAVIKNEEAVNLGVRALTEFYRDAGPDRVENTLDLLYRINDSWKNLGKCNTFTDALNDILK